MIHGPFAIALARAVHDSRPDDVPLLMAGALRAGEPWKEVCAEVLRTSGQCVDFTGGRNIHGVLSLIASARLGQQVPAEQALLPIGQAVAYVAGQPKWKQPPRWVEAGSKDDAHRDEFDLATAIAINAAREDPALVEEAVRALVHQASHFGGNWGHALIFATMTYDAGAMFGWEVVAPLFAVAVEHIIPSDRDEAAHEAAWTRFEKGHLDFSAIAKAPPSRKGEEEGGSLRRAMRRATLEEAATTVGSALERGVSVEVLTDALALAGADKMMRTSYSMSAAHSLTFAHAVRRAIAIQRDGCTIGAIAGAAAFMGSQVEVYDRRAEGSRAGKSQTPVPSPETFERLLREGPVADAVEGAQAVAQAGRTREPAYLAAVVRAASTDDLILSNGINLKHAEAALSEEAAVHGGDKSTFLMAVAKNICASERGADLHDKLLHAAAGRVKVQRVEGALHR